jgi:SAM-dependent methyltransferase
MKLRALDFLVCPDCHGTLTLHQDQVDGAEIVRGRLSCGPCAAEYPILGGVPRFVDSGAYAASFGYQWNFFKTVQLDSRSGMTESHETFRTCTGWTAADLDGRLTLDVGVGSGRFAEVAIEGGAELVGIDLTRAVDAAYDNLGRLPRVHLVQADVFRMPFRPRTFDLAYAIGVLHHTPDPEAAFGRMADALKVGGQIAVYLYAAYGPGPRCSDRIRTVTTRLPLPLMLAACTLAIPAHYVYKVPVVGHLLRVVAPISPHPHWKWRWLDTFDWYTPRYQFKYLYPEIFRWFRSRGFDQIEVFDGPIRMRGVKGTHAPAARPASPAQATSPVTPTASRTADPALAR